MEFFDKLKNSLMRTSKQLYAAFTSFTGADDDFYDMLEETLISADVGAAVSAGIVETLRQQVIKDGLRGADEIKAALANIMEGSLSSTDNTLRLNTRPSVILVIGVNGVGKTTTIGKLSAKYTAQGKKVLLCAGDTFRAAAGQQLTVWADHTGAGIIRREEGADPASVVFDAICAAKSRGSDILICDTAGRLHTKSNLMNELAKISRIIDRELPDSDKETLLVLDASTGQNGLNQAREFKDTAGITGIILTKLDGTAKGGIVYSIARELEIPVKLIGVGEKPEDLLDFDAAGFTEALLQ